MSWSGYQRALMKKPVWVKDFETVEEAVEWQRKDTVLRFLLPEGEELDMLEIGHSIYDNYTDYEENLFW